MRKFLWMGAGLGGLLCELGIIGFMLLANQPTVVDLITVGVVCAALAIGPYVSARAYDELGRVQKNPFES
jgi:hypothetical protein